MGACCSPTKISPQQKFLRLQYNVPRRPSILSPIPSLGLTFVYLRAFHITVDREPSASEKLGDELSGVFKFRR